MCCDEYCCRKASKDCSVGVGSEAFTMGKLGDTVLPPMMTDSGGTDAAAAAAAAAAADVDDDMLCTKWYVERVN